jgi:serine/threonine protein kinase
VAELKKCRACGVDVQSNAPFGHCPKCLLQLGFGPVPEDFFEEPVDGTNVRSFGDYELLEQIGRGGMGIVYKARQISLNRTVALKMISSGEFASPSAVQRFHIEAEAAAKLDHANIVPIYEVGLHRGHHYFSMKCVEGRSLDKEIRDGKFRMVARDVTSSKSAMRQQQASIARLISSVARSVHYAHQHGVLHRDLKPGNILLDDEGQPHLTDFGLAKILEHEVGVSGSNDVLGTPSYMSPEQAAGKLATRASDIYSLGTILYELLTGRPPFQADTPMETLRRVTQEEPTHPTTLNHQADAELATICLKCLEKDPLRRYASAEAMAEDLERWLRHEPIHARRASAGEKLVRWCQRNPKVAALVGSVALLLVAIATGSAMVALHIKSLSGEKEDNNRQLRNVVLNDLSKVYADPNTTSYVIPADLRHALAGRSRSQPITGATQELTAVEYVYKHPTNMLEIFSPILGAFEMNLSERLKRPVVIHLQIWRSYDLAFEALEFQPMTFGRVGPASYVSLLDKSRGVRLLAMQDHRNPLTLALFTKTNSAIDRDLQARPNISLADLLANRSMALGDSNSTTGSYFPRRYLATNGIFATNLSRYIHLSSLEKVIDEVRKGRSDFGAGNRDVVDNYTDLKVFAKLEFPNLGRCWVAGKGLDDTLAQDIRSCLLQLRDTNVLGKLESEVSGFKMMSGQTLDQLREIMRGAAAFDTGRRKQ